GHTVVVGAPTSWSKAGWSRGCRGTITYPAPDRDAAAFVAHIAEQVQREPGTLILPMAERTTLPLSEHREAVFAAGGRLVLPPHEVVLHTFDKFRTTRLAESLGIATPQTVLLDEAADPAALADRLRYPTVLKPRSSEEVVAGTVRTTGAPRYAQDRAQFLAAC